ncbi:ATP-dependent Clp protease ATP-binding subunit ClpC, partial [Bacillus cereus]|nr:ATP-dependent Clp protease ATP-binding subunit ClpC [Bacillus cereus]
SDRLLPDKAIDVLDEAASKTKMGRWELSPETGSREIRKWQAERDEALRRGDLPLVKMLQRKLERKKESFQLNAAGGYTVDSERIAEVVSDWSGVPVKQLSEEESERLRHLDTRLKQKIIGQDEAVEAVSRAIKR